MIEPRQKRGKDTVELILKISSDLFARDGYEKTTTNGIAEKAGIAIGSLYRYFRDKEDILRELASRHRDKLREYFDKSAPLQFPDLSLEAAVDHLVDPLLKMDFCYPEFRNLLLGSETSRELAESSERLESDILKRISAVLKNLVPSLPEEKSATAAVTCKAVVKGLLGVISAEKDGSREKIIGELKNLLVIYIESLRRTQ